MQRPEDRAEIDVDVTHEHGVCVVSVRGEIDVATADVVLSTVESCSLPMVIDLRDCTFMGGEGLRALLLGRRRADERGARLVVVLRSAGTVARLIDLIQGESLFDICVDDKGAAIQLARCRERRRSLDRRSSANTPT